MKNIIRKWLGITVGREALIRIKTLDRTVFVFRYFDTIDGKVLLDVETYLKEGLSPADIILIPSTVELHQVIEKQ